MYRKSVDGSLCVIYNFRGQWYANTRGSFGLSSIIQNEYEAKYHGIDNVSHMADAFCKAMGIKDLQELNLNPEFTYVCEFCSPWNKVVREYKVPCMYSLSSFKEREVGPVVTPYFLEVNRYSLRTVKEIEDFLLDHPEATFEGVVVKDKHNQRWKIKNARYVSLHHLKGNNNEGLYKPDRLIPFILKGEADELLTYFPELKECLQEYTEKIESSYNQLLAVWKANWQIENQKEFALSIQGKTPFTSLLLLIVKIRNKRDGRITQALA